MRFVPEESVGKVCFSCKENTVETAEDRGKCPQCKAEGDKVIRDYLEWAKKQDKIQAEFYHSLPQEDQEKYCIECHDPKSPRHNPDRVMYNRGKRVPPMCQNMCSLR